MPDSAEIQILTPVLRLVGSTPQGKANSCIYSQTPHPASPACKVSHILKHTTTPTDRLSPTFKADTPASGGKTTP
ncbi:hypothetical protein PGT21_019370 [Puccinia graminis f. sp. tritici]|uniref:Uncharacterized protein n=1 Tax=Puccinia graminis f. sp. tritici TaxID=56615 RepID=A0A5B0PER4_PUCGR|nr:hypothetical protein PGT21_019370 [Puccinia graminis f. sp. tritici]